jgi:alpha-L-fucosidase
MKAQLTRRRILASGLAVAGATAGAAAANPALARMTGGPAAPAPDGATPSARQWAWHGREYYGFVHFSMNTFTDKEWGYGDEDTKLFNPTDFNPDQIVAAAKAGGMGGLILTAKHHDGFCLWDTKLTDYNIMHTPFHRDVVKELAAACKRQGIEFGTYYSVTDWYDPDWPVTSPGGSVERRTSNLDAYEKYLQGQITELIQNYGPLLTIWNDVPAMYGPRGAETIKLVRRLQPGIVINDQDLVCAGIGSVHGIDLICNKCDSETCNNQKASVLGSLSHTVTALSLTSR